MFNLDRVIAEWRQQMEAEGVKAPNVLDELESHLREDVEQQVRSGLSAQQAFETAAQRIGQPGMLRVEFKKIRATTERTKQMIQAIAILTALFGTVFGGALVLPALGRWHHTRVLILWPLVIGTALVAVAGWAALYGIRRPQVARGRNLISVGIIAAGGFYVVPLIQAFFVPQADFMGWIFCAFLAVSSVSFFGTCFRFNRYFSSPPACED